MSLKVADGFDEGDGCPQRAIFRSPTRPAAGYTGHGLEMSLGGKDVAHEAPVPLSDRRDQTQAGYYANGVVEGLAQSLRLTLEHLQGVFDSPTIRDKFCGEARMAIPVHARRMLDHLAQIDRLIGQD